MLSHPTPTHPPTPSVPGQPKEWAMGHPNPQPSNPVPLPPMKPSVALTAPPKPHPADPNRPWPGLPPYPGVWAMTRPQPSNPTPLPPPTPTKFTGRLS